MTPICHTIDFETFPAADRPNYPSKPVGLAHRRPDERSDYLAYAHATGNNNSDESETKRRLEEIWASDLPVLFFNAKYDLDICYEVYGMPELPWQRVHDAMFLAFLADPHARDLSLKGLCTDMLQWPADERDAMGDWLWINRARLKDTYGIKMNRSAKTGLVTSTAKWTAYVPGDIAGDYAIGDVDRTWALFKHLYPLIVENGMLTAYERELQLLPILQANERDGMRIDLATMEQDVHGFRGEREKADAWLRDRLNSRSLNIDSDAEIAEAFSRERIIAPESWTPTASGEKWLYQNKNATMADLPYKMRSVSKDNLKPGMYLDPQVAAVFGYRNRLGTSLKMFMEPWLEQGSKRNGFISTNWNQTRGGDGGTRTGRPSTSRPNFLNISKSFDDRGDGYEHPEAIDVQGLPLVRKYILPDDDESLFLHRDFDGQELRVFAHFEDGDLAAQYRANAATDPHKYIQGVLLGSAAPHIAERFENRTNVKIMNFQSLYGGGLNAIANKLECSREEAKAFKAAHDAALPGRQDLVDEIMEIVGDGEPIMTWGGRLYFPEEPAFVKRFNRMMTFEYKLINYLIQGSAADITKDVLINWHNHPDRTARFLITVYDEINCSAHESEADKQMEVLKECMENVDLSVPMRSSGKYGTSWGNLIKEEA